jgi:hypothetical protein
MKDKDISKKLYTVCIACDWGTIAIFDSKDKAKKFMKKYPVHEPYSYCELNETCEYKLNPSGPQELREADAYFLFRIENKKKASK